MSDPTELTHEQLAALCECVSPTWIESVFREPLAEAGLIETAGGTRSLSVLTPRGRELVDIAWRAANAELRERGSR